MWSDEAEILVRPLRAYRALREVDDDELASPFERVVRMLLLVGAFVAVTTAGRLVPFHVATTFLAWSFVPALQAVALFVALKVMRVDVSFRRALSLQLAGNGAWLLALMAIAFVVVLSHDPLSVARVLLPALPFVALLVFAWGVGMTAACFSVGLELGRRRGAIATVLFYATMLLLVGLWYVALGEAQTLIRAV